MGLLTMFKGKKIIDAVETEVQTVTAFMEKDLKAIFTEAKEVALRSNERVANLKAELQKALIRSKNFHQAAIEAANAAADKAKSEATAFEAAAKAHTTDMLTQSSQIIDPTPDTPPVADNTTDTTQQ